MRKMNKIFKESNTYFNIIPSDIWRYIISPYLDLRSSKPGCISGHLSGTPTFILERKNDIIQIPNTRDFDGNPLFWVLSTGIVFDLDNKIYGNPKYIKIMLEHIDLIKHIGVGCLFQPLILHGQVCYVCCTDSSNGCLVFVIGSNYKYIPFKLYGMDKHEITSIDVPTGLYTNTKNLSSWRQLFIEVEDADGRQRIPVSSYITVGNDYIHIRSLYSSQVKIYQYQSSLNTWIFAGSYQLPFSEILSIVDDLHGHILVLRMGNSEELHIFDFNINSSNIILQRKQIIMIGMRMNDLTIDQAGDLYFISTEKLYKLST